MKALKREINLLTLMGFGTYFQYIVLALYSRAFKNSHKTAAIQLMTAQAHHRNMMAVLEIATAYSLQKWWLNGIACPHSSSRQPETILEVFLSSCETFSSRNLAELGDLVGDVMRSCCPPRVYCFRD